MRGDEDIDAELRAVAAGDAVALQRVYRLTSAKLFGICIRIAREPQAAEDILQATYLKIWNAADRFDPRRGSPITWMCTLARNTAVDWRRAADRGPQNAGAPSETVPDDAPPADTAIEVAQERARLLECLDALSDHQRSAIHAAFFEGDSYRELAERGSVPLGTMKSWIRRGLAQLRSCVDDR